MKTIQLKEDLEVLILNNAQVETKVKTVDLIKVALNSPVEGGYSISDIAFRIKILDIFDKADKSNMKEVQIEDGDYLLLSAIIKTTKWSVVSKTILDFVNGL